MKLTIKATPSELQAKAYDLIRSMMDRLAPLDSRVDALRRSAVSLEQAAIYMPSLPGGGVQDTNNGVRFYVAPERGDGSKNTDDSGTAPGAPPVTFEPALQSGFTPEFHEGYESSPAAMPVPVADPVIALGAAPMPAAEFEERSFEPTAQLVPSVDESPTENADTWAGRDGIPATPEQWVAASTLGYQQGSVMKRGYGRCEVRISPDREQVLVQLPDGETRMFKSVVAASNYTWCRVKGYGSVADWRAANPDAGDVPSGAGLRFWGLR